jgi:PAS domain S-box-containing protein
MYQPWRERPEVLAGHLAAIVESSNDAIIGKTLDGVIRSWNRGAERLFGYPADEAIGRPITILIPADRLSEERMILDQVVRGHRVEPYDTVRIGKDGRPLHVSLTVSPIHDGQGRIVGASKIARDISERRRLEEERVRLLEQERVMHAATQRAQQEAEAANRAKDEFLAMVSHELRTPLHAVTGWTRILRVKPDDPVLVQRALDAVDRNTELLTRVVNDLLDVSRFVAGEVALDKVPVDILPVVEAVLDTMRPMATAKGVVVDGTVDPWAGPVLGDPARLHQILANIVGNAVKFTPAGGRVTVRARNDGPWTELVVSDTGQGVAPDFLPHLFEAFRQAKSSTAGVQGGLGLGLAIVRHLVRLHEGTVTAESAGLGQGTRVTVRLPRVEDQPMPLR